MPAVIAQADAERIVRQLGAARKPAPDWVRNNPAYLAASHDAGGTIRPPPAPAPSSSTPAPAPAKRPARTRPPGRKPARSAPSSRPGYMTRAFSPTAAANRLGAGKLTSGGDAGGLLLALIVYPIFLSVIKYGAAGPGKWFRAKWLNQTDGFDWSQATPVDPNSKVPNYSGGSDGGGDVINFVDTKGDWGPKGATYPKGVWHSKTMILANGKSQTNPHYVGPGTPNKANI